MLAPYPSNQAKTDTPTAAAAGPMGMLGPWAAGMPFFSGADANGAAPGGAAAAMQPLQATQQAWIDFMTRFGSASPQSYMTGFDRTFGGLFDALGFGPMRKLQAASQELAAASLEQNQARAGYAMIVQGAFATGLERLMAQLAKMADEGERVESVLALLKMWAVQTEEAVHEQLQSPKGLAATAAMTRAGLSHRRKLQQVAAIVADSLDMATRRELDEVYREIHELKRELRALRSSAPSRPGSAAGVAANPLPNARPSQAASRGQGKTARDPEEKKEIMNPANRAMLASRAAAAVAITPASVASELEDARNKIARGLARLAEVSEDDLAIATVPRDEVWREDMVRLYRCKPVVEKPHAVPILITYALVGRFQMIDLEVDRSLVRKLLAQGFDVYFVDWGTPGRAQRWLTIDDYVSGYLDHCVDHIRDRSGERPDQPARHLPGRRFHDLLRGALSREGAKPRLHRDADRFPRRQARSANGSGYMNQWARAMTPKDIDDLVDVYGTAPGSLVGFAFLMMNPLSNVTKYTIDLVDVLDDETKLLNFLRMERWIADRPDHPGRSRAPVVQGSLPGEQADQERARARRPHRRACATSPCRC